MRKCAKALILTNDLSALLLVAIFLFSGCNNHQAVDYSLDMLADDDVEETELSETYGQNYIAVPYTEMYGNTIMLPVKINGVGLDMIFDTGASSTCITVAEAQYLYDKGLLSEDDMLDVQAYQTADGNISVGLRVVLREIVIGETICMSNIEALVVENQQAPLLLGQSVLRNFREVSVDRKNKVVKFYN